MHTQRQYKHTHVSTHTCAPTSIQAYILTSMHTSMHTHTQKHAHMHRHTCMNPYAHTHAPQMEKQHFHFAKCKAMAWLALSISANDLSMLPWLIYHKQGTKENYRPSLQSGYLHKSSFSQQRCFLWPSWVFLSSQM